MEVPGWAKGLWQPFKVGAYAFVSVLILLQVVPNKYRSEARILPVEGKGLGGGLGGVLSAANALGLSLPGEGADTNFVDIVQSRTLKEEVVKAPLTFHMRSWRFGEEREYTLDLQSLWHERNLDRAVKHLSEMISVSRDPKTKIIVVTAESRSQDLSRAIVERILRGLEESLQKRNRTRGSFKADYAKSRLAEARGEATQAEVDLRNFLDSNRNYQTSADPGIRLKGMRLEAELRLRTQLVTTLAMNREQAVLEEKNDIPILNVMDAPNLPIEKSGPARTFLALAFGLAAGALVWARFNKDLLIKLLFSKGPR